MTTTHVNVALGASSYPILIGSALFGAPATYAQAARGAQALIVTNTTVGPLYAQALAAAPSKLMRATGRPRSYASNLAESLLESRLVNKSRKRASTVMVV